MTNLFMTYPLSIVIVNFNTGKYLAGCLQSIQKTTANLSRPRIELIIVDNASTDDSVEGVTDTANIKIIRNKKNMGFARAVNQGIKKSAFGYILLLNPDTKVCEGAIENLLKFAESKKDAGVVGARLINKDSSIQSSVIPFPTPWRVIQEFWLGKKSAYLKYSPPLDDPVSVDSVVGAAFLITPQARKKVGLLDERFFMYFEDLDYCRRVKESGLKVYYLPTSEIIHYHGISGESVENPENQNKRLISSSKIYNGLFNYYLITVLLWAGQKWRIFFPKG